ncbi:MAG: hypothetical protein QNK70_01700 [Crocinitomicaceae bacterium]|tara:strand:- start:3592 stop:4104 length:513 start_codon:yes stop_codon:yes gene_type:complete
MSKQIIWFSLRLTFFIVLGIAYAILSAINPAPILNILMWLGLAFLIWHSAKEIKTQKQQMAFVTITTIILSYITLGIKSAFYIADFNEVYLGGNSGLLPTDWIPITTKSLISPSVWLEKVAFAFAFEMYSLKIGLFVLNFGLFGTKAMKIIELISWFAFYFFVRKKAIHN